MKKTVCSRADLMTRWKRPPAEDASAEERFSDDARATKVSRRKESRLNAELKACLPGEGKEGWREERRKERA